MMNIMRTALLMAALTGMFVVVGYFVGGEAGIAIALLFATAGNLFAYWKSDKMVLSIYGAREVDARTDPELVHLLSRLSGVAGLPTPRIYIVENEDANAFATGRNPRHAAVCVTSGLLRRVDSQELAGVLAHELSHIRSRDTLTMTLAAIIAGAVAVLANFAFFFGHYGRSRNPLELIDMLVVTLVAPVAVVLLQVTVSRTREFEADRSGAELLGRPLWLASALQRIESGPVTENLIADTNPAAAHMFTVKPLHGEFCGRFASHPSTEERIARLKAMAVAMERTPKSGLWP
ncbi:MAG TPA: M48 family metalloprotease [Rhizomicrobium sp.]